MSPQSLSPADVKDLFGGSRTSSAPEPSGCVDLLGPVTLPPAALAAAACVRRRQEGRLRAALHRLTDATVTPVEVPRGGWTATVRDARPAAVARPRKESASAREHAARGMEYLAAAAPVRRSVGGYGRSLRV